MKQLDIERLNRKERAFDTLHEHMFTSESEDEPIMCEYCDKPATTTDLHGDPATGDPREHDVCEQCKGIFVKKFTSQLKRCGII